MLLDPADLPATAVREEWYLDSGRRSMPVHRVPQACQGPDVIRDERNRPCLVYMRAFFLFRWVEGEGTVRVSHGYIGGRNNLALPWTLHIDEPWERAVLARRARGWLSGHLTRFQQ
jgi:hypothetical protein